ncbi:hypothetical protein [Rhodoplanes roseus]|uniref:hypothetical protein n=1 Tax=Rhodoplanes roseus TaxID=29409 RepID=UPI0011B3B285|nr:hypothetical protein [Rhodoplanes roseus]
MVAHSMIAIGSGAKRNGIAAIPAVRVILLLCDKTDNFTTRSRPVAAGDFIRHLVFTPVSSAESPVFTITT